MTREQLKQLEADLWGAANNLRANSDLKSSEYAIPVLGLIFLKFADNNYRRHEAEILAEYQKLKGTRREKKISDIAVEKCGFYPRRALSSDDTEKDRALAPDAQEPHPAGELLSARRTRGSDRSLRRPLQSSALPREHRQSDAGRRLLRAWSNHPAGKRKDQTQNHPTPTLHHKTHAA